MHPLFGHLTQNPQYFCYSHKTQNLLRNPRFLKISADFYLRLQQSSVEDANKNLQIFLKNEGFSIDFESCVNNKNIEDFVLNDRIEGAKNFKISSTPTIIINNVKFEKKLNYKNLKKALEKMI